MKKKRIFSILTAMIVALSFMQFNLNNEPIRDSNINQLGAAAIYASWNSESAADRNTGLAAGGIAIGVGASLIEAGVPTSMTPFGWGCIAAGCIL